MNIFCNGFPKSGNHALQKAVELLGYYTPVRHCPYQDYDPKDYSHTILIKRDPRNMLVSWLRFNQKLVTEGTFLAAFRMFQEKSLVVEMKDYEPYLNGFVVKYEDLIRDDVEMRRIADYLGLPYIEGAWEDLEGLTHTWNEVKSDYSSVWSPMVQAVWDKEGGNDLLTRWGY